MRMEAKINDKVGFTESVSIRLKICIGVLI